MIKKVPMRTCIGCGENKDKKSLVRIVRGEDGTMRPDLTGRASGRGCYLCRNLSCLELAVKRKAFNRAYKDTIPQEAVEALAESFKALCGEENHAG